MPQERVNLWQEDLRCLRLFSVPEKNSHISLFIRFTKEYTRL